ncbi:MAG: AzlC family ABC transporter permease [Chloroflexaceae bacterium]|nr:AzlC family ABC transporter permease [Chloroflexaceae bacterium]NJO07306.1 AzlC family ABC transporter permease [Chloroflexaceae bacterium]
MNTRRNQFLRGVRAELPVLMGAIPFGMVYGAAATSAGIPVSITQAMSSIVFAGSAQVVTAQLVQAATPGIVVVLTACLLNLRHILYSASIAPYLHHLPAVWRYGLPYLLTDEAYVVAMSHYTNERVDLQYKHWYVLGAGLILWLVWNLSTAAGLLIGAAIPPAWSLDFAIPLTFIALLLPALRDRASLSAALAAGILALVLATMPLKLGILSATLAGMVVGLLVEPRPTTPLAPIQPQPQERP